MNMICKFLCPPPVKMVHYLESAASWCSSRPVAPLELWS